MKTVQPIILTIIQQQDRLVFDLSELNSLIRKITMTFDQTICEQINAELLRFAENRKTEAEQQGPFEGFSGENHSSQMVRFGRVVYDQLFPVEIKKALSQQERTNLFLRLDDRLLHLPWELAHDGQQFLCSRFRIGRQIITTHEFERTGHADESEAERFRMLILCDPSGDLSGAQEESEQLAELFDRQSDFEIEIIGGKRATRLEVLQAFSDFDVIHFAGHSQYIPNDPEHSGWKLHDGLLTPSVIRKISSPPQLLFSNSCVSARVAGSQASGPLSTGLELGLGGSFLLSGVRNYIGALWPFQDQSGTAFAKNFYSQLLQGKSIGESLYLTRHTVMSALSAQNEDALGYIHYGRPDDAFVKPRTRARPQTDVPAAGKEAAQVLPGKRSQGFKSLLWALFLGGILVVCFVYFLVLSREETVLASYKQAVQDFQKGLIPSAMAQFSELIQRPDNQDFGYGYGDLAQIYLEADVTTKAASILEQALAQPTVNTLVFILQGDMDYQQRKYHEARQAYLQAMEVDNGLDSQWARAANNLGVLAWLDGNGEQSFDLFAKGLYRDPNNPLLILNRAFAEFSAGNLDNMSEDFFRTCCPEDEAARYLAQSLPEQSLATTPAPAQETKLSIGPFLLKGGTVKRLDYSWILAHMVKDRLKSRDRLNGLVLNPIAYADLPTVMRAVDFEPLADPDWLEFLTSHHADYAIFGRLSPHNHVCYLQVHLITIPEGHILLNTSLKAEAPDYLGKLAQHLGTEIEKIFQEHLLKEGGR